MGREDGWHEHRVLAPLSSHAVILGGADDRFVSSANLHRIGRPRNAMVCPTK
jgi:hypothetical protein